MYTALFCLEWTNCQQTAAKCCHAITGMGGTVCLPGRWQITCYFSAYNLYIVCETVGEASGNFRELLHCIHTSNKHFIRTISQIMTSAQCSPDTLLGILPNEFNVCHIRPENPFLKISKSFKCRPANFKQAFI